MSESSNKKTLISNFLSLSSLQAVNMLLPFITLPYLVRVLGIENFGLINFVLSIVMYFNILISFGFELSATREISINKNNLEKVSEIFSSIMIIKFLLFSFSFLILTILVLSVEKFNNDIILFYITFLIVFGNMIFPSWLFQGMEKMKYITYINVVSKSIFTILIFVIVKDENDFIYVPLLNGLGAIIGGMYSLYLAFNFFNIKLKIPSKNIILGYFKDSSHFFFSQISTNGSRFFATTMIGLYFGNTIVGIYTVAEKLFYAYSSLIAVITQTIYPYMSRTKNLKFFKKIFTLVIISSIVVIAFSMYINEYILFYIFDIKDELASTLFNLIFIGAIFYTIGAFLGYPLLASFGFVKEANNSFIYSSIIYLIFIFISSFVFENIYFVSLSLSVYFFTSSCFMIYYVKKNLNKIKELANV